MTSLWSVINNQTTSVLIIHPRTHYKIHKTLTRTSYYNPMPLNFQQASRKTLLNIFRLKRSQLGLEATLKTIWWKQWKVKLNSTERLLWCQQRTVSKRNSSYISLILIYRLALMRVFCNQYSSRKSRWTNNKLRWLTNNRIAATCQRSMIHRFQVRWTKT